MKKLIIMASVVVLAASGAACGSHNDSDRSSGSILGPSSTDARGGGGNGGGKPGGGGSTGGGSLSLVMLSDANGNGLPNWGDRITFNLTTTATSPFVSVNCYQGSSWVYAASVGYFEANPWAKEFTLSATSWPGGAAECTARLYTSLDGSSTTTLATLSFHVSE